MARLARILAAVALGLVLAELGLRATGWGYLRAAGRSREVLAAGPGGLSVLCAGDSNTFGMFEPAPEAYPARLAALLDARADGGPHAVANLGMPGMTTGHVLGLLERRLGETRPDAVIVLAGVNNGWGWRGDQDVDVSTPVARLPWYEDLRLWKTLRLLRHYAAEDGRNAAAPQRARPGDFDGAPVGEGRGERLLGVGRQGEDVVFEIHALEETLAPDAFESSVRRDLARIGALAAERGVRLVLLTYAGGRDGYGKANDAIRRAAADLDVPLVDCEPAMTAAVERHGYEALLYPDQHPKGAGYELVARLVFNALVESGLARADPIVAPLADLPLDERPPSPLRLVSAARTGRDDVYLEITGEEPGRDFRVVLSDAGDGAPARLKGLVLPVRGDALYRATVDLPAMQGTFDGQGAARVSLGAIVGPRRLSELERRPLLAAYVTYVNSNRRRVRWFSDAAELRTIDGVGAPAQ